MRGSANAANKTNETASIAAAETVIPPEVNEKTRELVDSLLERASELVQKTHEEGAKENIKNLKKISKILN